MAFEYVVTTPFGDHAVGEHLTEDQVPSENMSMCVRKLVADPEPPPSPPEPASAEKE